MKRRDNAPLSAEIFTKVSVRCTLLRLNPQRSRGPAKARPPDAFRKKKDKRETQRRKKRRGPKPKPGGGVRALSSSKVPIECLSRICRQWELTASNISQRRRCRRIDSPLIFCRPTAAHHQSNSSTTILTTSRFHVSFWAPKTWPTFKEKALEFALLPDGCNGSFC